MKYALINGVLLDGTEAMQPRPGLTVLVNGDRIEGVVPAGTEPPDLTSMSTCPPRASPPSSKRTPKRPSA